MQRKVKNFVKNPVYWAILLPETDQEFAEQIASIKDSKGNRKYSDADIEAGKNSRFGSFYY
jgi:hypothetical protein